MGAEAIAFGTVAPGTTRRHPLDTGQLMPRWIASIAPVVLLLALLAACGAPSDGVTAGAEPSFRSLQAGAGIGQSFVAYHDGLAGVAVLLRPEAPGEGALLATLREGKEGPTLASAWLPLSAVTDAALYPLRFERALPSQQRDVFLSLELIGAGSVQVGVLPGAAFRDGALYVAGEPADEQLVHTPIFATIPRLLGAARSLLGLLWPLFAALMVCVLPGLGLLALADGPGRQRGWAERLALALGISVALLPLLLVWARLAGLKPGPLTVWVPALASAALLAWRGRGLRPAALRAWRPDPADLGLIVLLALITGVRLVVVVGLEAPLWGDSYQHAMIARLILDNGGLFDSWRPYEPYESLTVQFGFSAVAAGLAWAGGFDAVAATLLAGQLLNAAAVITLYPLALRLSGGNRWAGAVAVLVAGLLMPLPGIYVNWGRYAQLSGQVVLPVAMVLSWDLLAERRGPWRHGPLVGLVVAGMALCYYRMVFYYVAFMGVLLLCWGLPRWRMRWGDWLAAAWRLALAGLCTALAFAPWAMHVASSPLANTVATAAAQGTPWDYVRADYQAWAQLPALVPWPLLLASGAALIWALVRRAWLVVGLGLWQLLLASYMAGSLVGIPGAVMLQSFAVLIALYIPVALLCGWLAAELIAFLGQRHARVAAAIPAVALTTLAAWGGLQQARIVDPSYILVTRPDTRAMRWISAHTPPEARFLVHGFTVYGGDSAVGADAGWWIPLLAGRANTMPPQYALSNERSDPPGYSQHVIALVETLRTTPPTTPQGLRALCEAGVTHLYTGQGQGAVGFGATPLFSPMALRRDPHYTLVYAEDRVTIFALDRGACAMAGAP